MNLSRIFRQSVAILVIATMALTAFSANAMADIMTSASQLNAGATTINFASESFVNPNLTEGPAQVGTLVGRNIVWTALGSSYLPQPGLQYSAPGGTWTGTGIFQFFVDGSGNGMTFTFADAPVQQVGGFMDGTDEITAYGQNGQVLESCDLDTEDSITATGPDAGAFRGISDSTADIYALQLTALSSGSDAISSLSFAGAPSVPEPSGLFCVVLGPMALLMRERCRALPSR